MHLPDGTRTEVDLDAGVGPLIETARTLGIGWDARRTGTHEGPQIWLTEAAARSVGLVVDELPDEPTKADAALARHGDRCSWLDDPDHGWQRRGRLGAWVTYTHDEHGRARLVVMPYCTGQLRPGMIDDDPAPTVLARRLLAMAKLLGIPYRITPAVTGADLMHALRPRARADRSTSRVTALDRPVQQPPFLDQPPLDEPHPDAEVYFCRKPLADEAEHPYVHVYDRNGQYLSSASRLYLGSEDDPIHHDGPIDLDDRQPGFVRAAAPASWDHWTLPNPWQPTGERDRVHEALWMPTTYASWLAELGYTLDITEAWTWPTSSAYLDPWVKVMREARKTVEARRHDQPDAAAIRSDIKICYAAGLGKLADRRVAGRDLERHRATYRPDWYSLIKGKSRANVQRLVQTIGDSSGRWPILIREDAIGYTSTESDPIAAWPGDPAKLNTNLGGMKPYKAGLLSDVVDLLPVRPYAHTTRKILDRLTGLTDATGAEE